MAKTRRAFGQHQLEQRVATLERLLEVERQARYDLAAIVHAQAQRIQELEDEARNRRD